MLHQHSADTGVLPLPRLPLCQSRARSVCGIFLVQLILNFSQDLENTRLANASFEPPRRCVLRPCPAPNKCRAHA